MSARALLMAAASAPPPGSTLDLSFMSPGSLDPRITFTRASTGTYFDAAGTLQTATASTPRWDYNPSTQALQGLLIEEARTNLLLWSTDFTNAAWALFNGATKGATIVGPGGTAGMTVNFSSTYPSQFYQSISGYPAGTTFSVWARANTLSSFQLRFSVDGNSPTLTLTSQWQRFSFVTTGSTNTNVAIQNAAATAGSIDIAMPQLEAGAFPTSYIGTTSASVTRAQDSCTMSSANMSPWFASPGGSWAAEFITFSPQPGGSSMRVVGAPGAGGIGPVFLMAGTPVNGLGQYEGSAVNTTNAVAVNTIGKGATTWAVGSAKACLNGGAVVTSAGLATGYGALATSGVRFGANATAVDGMSGYFRRVRYWPRVLTNAELQSVTR